MMVIPQVLGGHFKDKEVFDFSVNFLMVNPQDKCTEAAYVFNKYGSGKKKKADEADFLGSLQFNTAEKKPYQFDTFAGRFVEKVEAQVDLDSFNSTSFTITVSRPKKQNHTVDLTFMGDVPPWLSDGQVWHGKLLIYEIKDLCGRS